MALVSPYIPTNCAPAHLIKYDIIFNITSFDTFIPKPLEEDCWPKPVNELANERQRSGLYTNISHSI